MWVILCPRQSGLEYCWRLDSSVGQIWWESTLLIPERVRNRYPTEMVSQVFEVPVRIESILDAEPDGELFDTMTCISTLEHIGFDFASSPEDKDSAFARATSAETANTERDSETDRLFLDAAARFLRPGGSLLVSVPAGKRWTNFASRFLRVSLPINLSTTQVIGRRLFLIPDSKIESDSYFRTRLTIRLARGCKLCSTRRPNQRSQTFCHWLRNGSP